MECLAFIFFYGPESEILLHSAIDLARSLARAPLFLPRKYLRRKQKDEKKTRAFYLRGNMRCPLKCVFYSNVRLGLWIQNYVNKSSVGHYPLAWNRHFFVLYGSWSRSWWLQGGETINNSGQTTIRETVTQSWRTTEQHSFNGGETLSRRVRERERERGREEREEMN